MERARERLASRRVVGSLVRPHHCATSANRCTVMRSNRPFAAAMARKPHSRALHARASFLARARSAMRAIC
eukprot:47732-Lingulodinium_polyedra.AAC.1